MSERDPKSYTYAGWAEAFEIFARYSLSEGADYGVSAEHDELLAGPSPVVVAPADVARLEALGWHPVKEHGCFRRCT